MKMITIFVLFACMLALSGCTSEPVQSQDNSGAVDSVSDAGDSVLDTDKAGSPSQDEREMYAKFEAEFACSIIGVEGQEEIEAVLDNLGSLIEKYGFTAEDIERLRKEFEGDYALADMILEEMRMMCPEDLENQVFSSPVE